MASGGHFDFRNPLDRRPRWKHGRRIHNRGYVKLLGERWWRNHWTGECNKG